MEVTETEEEAKRTTTTTERAVRWDEMPRDILPTIFRKLDVKEVLLSIPLVCRSWRAATFDPICWHTVDVHRFADVPYYARQDWIFTLVKAIVNRSGTAVRCLIFSTKFGITDHHLLCISKKTPGLKRLVMPNFDHVSPNGFRNALSDWTELESLTVFPRDECITPHPKLQKLPPNYFSDLMKAIGDKCKRLVALRILNTIYPHKATAIVENLSGTVTLDVTKSPVSEEGMLILLNGFRDLRRMNVLVTDIPAALAFPWG